MVQLFISPDEKEIFRSHDWEETNHEQRLRCRVCGINILKIGDNYCTEVRLSEIEKSERLIPLIKCNDVIIRDIIT